MANLAARLYERRKAKGLTLSQLSKMSGVHISYLGRIERAERFPSGFILKKLAEPLDFTEVELLKLAGYLSRDDNDVRIDRLRFEVSKEIALAFSTLIDKIDSL